jgi:hypothetical protein
MTVVKLPQVMIDEAVDDVLFEYDERGSVATRVVAYLDGDKKQTIELSGSGGVIQYIANCDEAKKAAEAIGAKQWTFIGYVSEQGTELIFVSACNGSHRELCALRIDRKTGISFEDIKLVTDFKSDMGFELSFCTPSLWGGPYCTLDFLTTAEIFKWPIKEHFQNDVGREASDTVSDSKSDK